MSLDPNAPTPLDPAASQAQEIADLRRRMAVQERGALRGQAPWVALSLNASWASLLADPPSYYRNPDGHVFLRGAVTNPFAAWGGGAGLFLPAGVRPKHSAAFATFAVYPGGGSSTIGLAVNPGGDIQVPAVPINTLVWIDGANWRVF